MLSKKVEIGLLTETSWEVCNKVGGIYTVLSTKAKNLQTLYKDKVVFIGPDVWTDANPCPVFSESKLLLKKWRESAELPEGVSIRIGRWKIPGRPIAVLVRFDGMYAVRNEFYGEMWQKFGVDSLHAYGDYDEACAFSHAAGIVIESLTRFLKVDPSKTIAHFDEWTTGMGLLYVKDRMPGVATIFTTHATSIGRSICGNGKNLYQYFREYNGDIMARELNMEAKHSLEKAAAHNADCFTTVSDLTADECEQLLDIRPQVVTPNGFEENFVPEKNVFAKRRLSARRKMFRVAQALTGNVYRKDTFIIATAGRCEYRNKGLDMFIDSINRLSDLDNRRKILAFIMVPAWVKAPRRDLAHNLALEQSGQLSDPIYTHEVHNLYDDAVLRHIRKAAFRNDTSSNVTLVYVPCYLNGTDGIFNKSYYDLLIGMDATVFPSYYEPWGYTPLESIAFGVPTVTTNLSGFGRWVLDNFDNNVDSAGVAVVDRTDTNYNETCNEIATVLKHILSSHKEERAAIGDAARETASNATWEYFIRYYVDAFRLALRNAKKRNK